MQLTIGPQEPTDGREARVAPVGWQELPGRFEVDATTARVQRRLEYVLRQLEWRIMETDRLRAQLDEGQARLDEGQARLDEGQAQLDEGQTQLEILRRRLDIQNRETEAWRNAYEAIMATKTMRVARIPRALYARIRGRR
jgi:chromosome segregation ATPase